MTALPIATAPLAASRHAHDGPRAGAGGAPSNIPVPAEIRAALDAAVAAGTADAATFVAEHGRGDRALIPQWALLKMVWPPKDDAAELAVLHATAATRTPEGVEAARFWASHGLTDQWEQLLGDYTSQVGPAQAREARRLLHDALMMTNQATQTGKAASGRKRPFVVDPTLPLAVDRPGNNPSYPSGHASAAYAACMVLSHLMPDRRAEFTDIARQAAYARVYAGVHFPSDIVAGARMAATVTAALTQSSATRPRRGTAQAARNGGVAGGRALAMRPLAGAVVLAGRRISDVDGSVPPGSGRLTSST